MAALLFDNTDERVEVAVYRSLLPISRMMMMLMLEMRIMVINHDETETLNVDQFNSLSLKRDIALFCILLLRTLATSATDGARDTCVKQGRLGTLRHT